MSHDLPTPGTVAIRRPRSLEYLSLAKPELTLLSVLTAVGAALLAMHGMIQGLVLVHVFVGTALVGGGAGALNQYLERAFDALMRRTDQRPLPSGRLKPREALVFGVSFAVAGVAYLTLLTTVIAGVLACVTLASYLLVYTPLKRRTPFATVVGGIPGALPPLIGWSAVRGGITIDGWALFFILFFWQMPHFLALAWMYRKDYARAGYLLLTVVDPEGVATSRQILVYCMALVPAVLMPTLVGLTGIVYFAGALVLSTGFLLVAVRLYRERTNANARRLFFASLAFLPTLFCLMVIDRLG
jgi:protoheme IX farnesyltransferase